jgi:hypothetical protein
MKLSFPFGFSRARSQVSGDAGRVRKRSIVAARDVGMILPRFDDAFEKFEKVREFQAPAQRSPLVQIPPADIAVCIDVAGPRASSLEQVQLCRNSSAKFGARFSRSSRLVAA